MNLKEQCEFAQIYSKFNNQSHSMEDISELAEIIRRCRKSLSFDAKKCLCSILLQVLENQAMLTNQIEWQKSGEYFSGNMAGNEVFQKNYKEKFSENLEWIDMIDLLREIMTDEAKLSSDFYLRNIEVTLRDFAEEKPCTYFKESGSIFARLMEEAFLK